MEEGKKKIKQILDELQEMIETQQEKSEIEEKRKQLDKLLEEYIKNI